MKKLTTTQWLLVGGTVALIWMLFSKKKMNATEIKKEIEKDLGSETGGVKTAPSEFSKVCEQKYQKWNQLSKVSKFGSLEEREKARKEVLGECIDYNPKTFDLKTGLISPVTKTAQITR